MTRHIALLRGINVGRAKRVAMADLRELLGVLGYSNVLTLLNSGNAVFDGPPGIPGEIGERIHAALAEELGVSAQVVVKSASEWKSIVAGNTLIDVAADPSRLLVAFTQDRSALSSLDRLVQQDWSPEALVVGKHAAYLWCPNGVIASEVAREVGRSLGELGTTRNWSTVEKIHALVEETALG